MKTKRVIISLRDDELNLLMLILKDYQETMNRSVAAAKPATPIQLQAQKLLDDGIQKIIKKLEGKNNG